MYFPDYVFSENDGKAERRAAVVAASKMAEFPLRPSRVSEKINSGALCWELEGETQNGKPYVRWCREGRSGHKVRARWVSLAFTLKRMTEEPRYDCALSVPCSYRDALRPADWKSAVELILSELAPLHSGADSSLFAALEKAVIDSVNMIRRGEYDGFVMGRWYRTNASKSADSGEAMTCSFFVCRQDCSWLFRYYFHPAGVPSSVDNASKAAQLVGYVPSKRQPRKGRKNRKKDEPLIVFDNDDDDDDDGGKAVVAPAKVAPANKPAPKARTFRDADCSVTIIEHEPPRWRDM
jgi:hypothetical protein